MIRRKALPIILATLALSLGCTGKATKIRPYVADNTYVSPADPELSITFDPSYKYLGEATRSLTEGDDKKEDRSAFIFVQSRDGKNVDSAAAVIRITRNTKWKFPHILFKHCGHFAIGIANIDNTYYQTKSDPNTANKQSFVTNFISNKGYHMPEKHLSTDIVKHNSDNEMFIISFATKIEDIEIYQDKTISAQETEAFDNFTKEFFSSIKIKGKAKDTPVYLEYLLPICKDDQDGDKATPSSITPIRYNKGAL